MIAPDCEQLLREIIGQIYDAASDSRAWHKVLESITHLTMSKSAVLLYQDHEVHHASTFSSYGVESQWLTLYNEKYGAIDPSLQIIASVPTGHLTANHLALDAEQFYMSDTYQEFYKPQGMYHLAGTWLMRNEHRSALLGFQREKSAPEYEQEVLDMVRELVPHFQRALHIHRIHTEAVVKNDAFASGIDTMQTGVVFFNHQSQISYCNRSAKTIIDQHPAISRRNDMISATSDESNQKLRKAIAAACLANLNGMNSDPVSLGLRHPSRFAPLPVVVLPIHQSDLSIYLSDRSVAAVMIVTDPDRIMLTSPELLATIYDLTKAEAEVAIALANAKSPQEIADEKNVMITTIRSQIQSIFNKMGVNTQAQLIRTLLNSPLASVRVETCLRGELR